MFDEIDEGRRRLLTAGAMSFAAAELGLFTPAPVQATSSISTNTFGPLKQIGTDVLNIGYAEAGPATGTPVILLHGWPYDIHSYVDVAPILAAAGYRVLIPYLRGYGTTRFLSADTIRNGQQAAVATDILAFMDALKIQKAVVAGFDWGARTAVIMAALWPERCKAIVAVSGYIVTNLTANQQPLPPQAELGWWYQYYFATERGERGYTQYRRDFNKLIWKIASPKWAFDDATYERSATAFDNPDHVAIVIHNYRWRLSLAKGEARYDEQEQKLFAAPAITVPSITIGSDFDGANADGAAYAKKFTGKHAHRVLNGIGHNVPQEAPDAFARAVIDADRSIGS